MSTAAEDTHPNDPRPADVPSDGPDAAGAPAVLVARASTSYRVRWGLIGLMFIAAGGWFAYDGWVTYPRANAEALRKGDKPPHTDGDDIVRSALMGREIPLQRLLALVLPPIGLLLLGYMVYQSRGEYRLEGGVLHVPGHPPVPLENVRQIDETRWDRKGIALLDYEGPASGRTGRVRLDDQRYAMTPTDAIFDRIKAVLVPATETAEAAAGGVADDGASVESPADTDRTTDNA
jgi:hypothetical protein